MTDTKVTYTNLASALAAFQANIPTPAKDSEASIPSKTGAGYKYDYASLDKLTPIILPALAAVGLSYTAIPDWNEQGFGLRAQLLHESGEAIGGFYPLGSPTNPAQAIGSAITYARRYALLALTGVAPGGEDDDGAAATSAQGEANAKAPVKANTPAKETITSVREDMSAIIDNSEGRVGPQDANTVMEEIAPGKTIAEWTLTDLKKGREKLQEVADQRAKAAK